MVRGSIKQNVAVLISLGVLIIINGCSTQSSSVAPEVVDEPILETSTVALFDDIVLPSEMKRKNKDVIFNNPIFKGGRYHFGGNVDADSLKNFITISMRNNKWKFGGETIVRKESFLVFTKPNKTCFFIIKDDLLRTSLEIMVGADLSASANLNPFGEPQ